MSEELKGLATVAHSSRDWREDKQGRSFAFEELYKREWAHVLAKVSSKIDVLQAS